ncbi:MAG: YdaU family protein [Alphaproteobacteria bacterium]|nr:YdaU family protein [Alphaproteobacteria bacterium]
MHYYKRHLGDYAKKAGRLSMLEHGAYTLLIDACYDRERFPTKAEAIKWAWARTPEEVAAVEFILEHFFDFDGEVYKQARIEEEIANFHEKSIKNKKIANDREEKRRNDRARSVHEASSVVHEPPPNHKPLTINHISSTDVEDSRAKRSKTISVSDLKALDVLEQHANDWLAVRKQKRMPLTQTALDGIAAEAKRAGLSLAVAIKISAERGWASFKADWLHNDAQKQNGNRVDYMEGTRAVHNTIRAFGQLGDDGNGRFETASTTLLGS